MAKNKFSAVRRQATHAIRVHNYFSQHIALHKMQIEICVFVVGWQIGHLPITVCYCR